MNAMNVNRDLVRAASTGVTGRGTRAARGHGSALGLLLRALAVVALVAGSLTIGAPAAFAAPPAPTQIAPSGSATTTPTYTWNAAGSGSTLATFYQLFVRGPTGAVINQGYSATQAGCAAGGRCSIRPATALAPGATYTWHVAAYNATGWGPWSRGLSFATGAPPPRAILVAPSGTVNTTLPTYIWNAAGTGGTRATSYRLRIQTEFTVPGRNRVIFDRWITAADAGCAAPAATVCRFAGITGGPGAHTWYIQTGNAVGYGPWSGGLGFIRT